MDFTNCPKCQGSNVYHDGMIWNCPDCAHEWNEADVADQGNVSTGAEVIKDAFGTILSDGDSVTLIKELRFKGSTQAIKVGTKAKNIRLTDNGDGHDIACKIEGFGSVYLKSEFVKKA